MHGLSKSRILAHRQCPKRLWLAAHRPDLAEYDAGGTARLQSGQEAGEVARTLFRNGLLIEADDLQQALAETAAALSGDPRPLFEATFQADGVLVRVDLLLPTEGGFRLAEVKSSTRIKDYHYADAAVQAWVTRRAGIPLTAVEIAHIDSGFVYPGGGNYQGLFRHVDITADIAGMEAEIPDWITAARATLAGQAPDIEPGDQCRAPFDCPFLGHCCPADGEAEDGYPVEILPRGARVAAELRAEGIADIRDIPPERLSNAIYRRIGRACQSGQAELDPEAREILAALPFPRYFLDFETIQFAVPIWPGTRPYQQIPFQWSCHIDTDASGTFTIPNGFLAEDRSDPRRPFAESLVRLLSEPPADTTAHDLSHGVSGPYVLRELGLPGEGPILVYNAGFERGQLRALAETFPDLAPVLLAAADRIVDLLPIARRHYYHPDMRGSWSLKAVAPTLGLTYDDLGVGDGMEAQIAFLEMTDPDTTPERRWAVRDALRGYCALDTYSAAICRSQSSHSFASIHSLNCLKS